MATASADLLAVVKKKGYVTTDKPKPAARGYKAMEVGGKEYWVPARFGSTSSGASRSSGSDVSKPNLTTARQWVRQGWADDIRATLDRAVGDVEKEQSAARVREAVANIDALVEAGLLTDAEAAKARARAEKA